MENRDYEINNLITKIASNNAHITASQIARARAIYQGDTRPLSEIEAELNAYSEEITREATKNKGMPTDIGEKYTEKSVPDISHDSVEEPAVEQLEDIDNISVDRTGDVGISPIESDEPITVEPIQSEHFPEIRQEHQFDNIRVDHTGDVGITPVGKDGFIPGITSSRNDLDMMFAAPAAPLTNNAALVHEKPKQFVKTQESNVSSEAGYVTSTAMLATAGVLSIITITIAIAILMF